MSEARIDTDIYRLSSSVDEATSEVMASRLEFRATDPGYMQIANWYFDKLTLSPGQRVISIGCGTGVEVRALGRLTQGQVDILGVDQSQALVEFARRQTAAEGLAQGIHYALDDAHSLNYPDETFDVAILHTLVSHVDDPARVLTEARRVVRSGGTVAIFDGDYASITFDHPDHQLEASIEQALMRTLIANPRVMREMPRLLKTAGLEMSDARAWVYANIGTGAFWSNVPETYGAVLKRSGLLPEDVVEAWASHQKRAVGEETFFGASNYYTYLCNRP
jgi:SAM-dependent methyltransferase